MNHKKELQWRLWVDWSSEVLRLADGKSLARERLQASLGEASRKHHPKRSSILARGSIYITIMESGPQRPSLQWF